MQSKKEILSTAKNHVKKVSLQLEKLGKETELSIRRSREIYKTLSAADKIVEDLLTKYNKKRVNEVSYMKGIPYFVRCDVVWKGENEIKSLYFGKFSFSEEEVYSWIAPASAMRFEEPGKVSYIRPDGKMQKAELVRKDQYMITSGEIKFLATEKLGKQRQLVYQQYFSNRKTGFILPEIVAQMEKAQDEVIRAHHIGPFLISGPAGSGKTTLALHRVAYLVQSPDIANIYKSDSIIIFVQDNGTKEYFSHLLPELGIDDVCIVTFSEWALSILEIDAKYVVRYGKSENEKDEYEFAKLKALRQPELFSYKKRSIKTNLENVYNQQFNSEQKKIFQKQKKENYLDRIDLTLLLKAYLNSNKNLGRIQEYWAELKNGSFRKKKGFIPLDYSLAVIDEFQNYLPEQLALIKSCINKKSQSVLYVGDLAQQVQLGTIKSWEEIGEKISEGRDVILSKVYRNTKNILRYIHDLGYSIEVPEKIKEGNVVEEHIFTTKQDEFSYIRKVIESRAGSSFGILAKNETYLSDFKQVFSEKKNIHIMTMNEAQGVEFDVVFLVGIDDDTLRISFGMDVEELLKEEKRKINKDLLYVALTRAISELHILGRKKLGEVIQF